MNFDADREQRLVNEKACAALLAALKKHHQMPMAQDWREDPVPKRIQADPADGLRSSSGWME